MKKQVLTAAILIGLSLPAVALGAEIARDPSKADVGRTSDINANLYSASASETLLAPGQIDLDAWKVKTNTLYGTNTKLRRAQNPRSFSSPIYADASAQDPRNNKGFIHGFLHYYDTAPSINIDSSAPLSLPTTNAVPTNVSAGLGIRFTLK